MCHRRFVSRSARSFVAAYAVLFLAGCGDDSRTTGSMLQISSEAKVVQEDMKEAMARTAEGEAGRTEGDGKTRHREGAHHIQRCRQGVTVKSQAIPGGRRVSERSRPTSRHPEKRRAIRIESDSCLLTELPFFYLFRATPAKGER